MRKRLVSMILALVMCIGPTTLGIAVEDKETNDNNTIIKYNGITSEMIDNKIYINGKLEATIVETVKEAPMNTILRTGWTYTNTCPFGNSTEYTKFIKVKEKNIQLEKDLITYTAAVLGVIIGYCYPDPNVGAAVTVAGTILSNVPGSQYGNLKTLYFKEYIYGHSTLSSIYRMNKLLYYYDSAYTAYVTMDIYYSWWG